MDKGARAKKALEVSGLRDLTNSGLMSVNGGRGRGAGNPVPTPAGLVGWLQRWWSGR